MGEIFFIINDIIKLLNLLKALLFLMLIGILRRDIYRRIINICFGYKQNYVLRKKVSMTCYRT